jgi:hypothetical protein
LDRLDLGGCRLRPEPNRLRGIPRNPPCKAVNAGLEERGRILWSAPPGDYDWGPKNLNDGDTGTHWVPRKKDADHGHAYMKFTFKTKQDLQLICVVNGDASNDLSYERANRIRTASVSTDAAQGRVSPLLTVDSYAIQNPQPLNFDAGKTKTVVIRIASIYNGRKIFEPKGGVPTQEDPTGYTAVSEVQFYVANRSHEPWWKQL